MYDQLEEEGKRTLESLKADAHKRQQEGAKKGGGDRKSAAYKADRSTQLIEQGDFDRNERSTTAIRAKEAGTNRTYLEFADKVVKEHPEIAEKIRDGNLQISTAMRKVKTEEVVKKGLERGGYLQPDTKNILELAAEQEALNLWGRACDGLTAISSYANTFTPPANIPKNQPSVSDFKQRLCSVSKIVDTWRDQ